MVRVKILYNKRDSALIQFKDPQQIHTGELKKYHAYHRNVPSFDWPNSRSVGKQPSSFPTLQYFKLRYWYCSKEPYALMCVFLSRVMNRSVVALADTF